MPKHIPSAKFDVNFFFHSDFFGIEIKDSSGRLIRRLQTIAKIGDRSANFGQPPNGGMTKIDQRQLNILYCERPKAALIVQELETTLLHTIREYEGTGQENYAKALTTKLSRIYGDYWFPILLLEENIAQVRFGIQHNGNCIGPYSQFGRTVILCWARKDSFNRRQQHWKVRRVFRSSLTAINALQVRYL